jgi:AcrR family transcriptional regulator
MPRATKSPIERGTVTSVAGNASSAGADRVAERHRAVAMARHYRDFEGLSIRGIADRLGRSPATVKSYFYDPTGEKARAVKARYRRVCRGCGAYTQPLNGKGDAYAYCKACHPGAIGRRWTPERVLAAMIEWRSRYGRLPTSYDWSRTHAGWRGGQALEQLARGDWPSASVVTRLFGTWDVARATAGRQKREVPTSLPPSATSPLGSNSISLPKPRESTAKSANPRGGGATTKPPNHPISRYFSQQPRISPIFRVGEDGGSNPRAPISTNPRSDGGFVV